MSAALKLNLVSVEDYLAGELISPIKHEYVGGVVHAMAGARVAHNVIASNILGAVHARLRGKRCQVFNSDMKVRLQVNDQNRFYYPDATVICRSNPSTDSFQDEPAVIFEVLSKATRRIDLGEKKDAYLTCRSLQAYVLVEQDGPLVVVYRRGPAGFNREVYEGLDANVLLSEVEIELPLAEVYERVEFVPEPEDENA
jgi:Uma2 family endonuclease